MRRQSGLHYLPLLLMSTLILIYTVSDLVIRPTVFGVFLVISGQFTAASCGDWTFAVLRIPLLSSHLHHFQSPSQPAYDPSDHCLTIDCWVNVREATASCFKIYPPFSCPVSKLELKNHVLRKRQWKLHPKSLPCVNLVSLSQSAQVWFLLKFKISNSTLLPGSVSLQRTDAVVLAKHIPTN